MFDFIFDLFSSGNKYKVNLNPDQKKDVETYHQGIDRDRY